MPMIKGYDGSLYGTHRQKTFYDVYKDDDAFLSDYKTIGIPTSVGEDTVRTIYCLLYANYGNSTIASSDIYRFKFKLFSIVFSCAPTWERRMELQQRLRSMTDDELLTGSRQIYNAAQNPSAAPSTETDDELKFINSQNVTKNRRGVLEGYSVLETLLDSDLTSDFLKRFKPLFLSIVSPELPLIYVND